MDTIDECMGEECIIFSIDFIEDQVLEVIQCFSRAVEEKQEDKIKELALFLKAKEQELINLKKMLQLKKQELSNELRAKEQESVLENKQIEDLEIINNACTNPIEGKQGVLEKRSFSGVECMDSPQLFPRGKCANEGAKVQGASSQSQFFIRSHRSHSEEDNSAMEELKKAMKHDFKLSGSK